MKVESLWGVNQHGGVRKHEVHELVPEDAGHLEMRVIAKNLSRGLPGR